MKKNSIKIILFYAVIILGMVIVIATMFNGADQKKTEYGDLVDLFQNEEVKSFVVDGSNNIIIETHDDRELTYKLKDFSIFYYDFSELIKEQKAEGIIESYDYEPPADMPYWVRFLPYIILMVLFAVMWYFMMRQTTGTKNGRSGSFVKSRAKLGADEAKKVYFDDVAGADEEKEELREIVEFLRNPARFSKLGAKIPHGVLLVGPPGTGKTLLAKAVAGEANVPFYSISGSDFVELYVGVGASRVRDLFEVAKKNPASIIFIDEIDAVGRHRGAGLGGGHDEREQTLNQLLVEMDGFGSNEGIIVIAATNRPDILDPALLRPGRFDRQVTVNYPDVRGREAILKVHAKNKPFEKTVDFGVIAKTAVGFTGADLANLLNESALLAAKRNKELIGMDEIEDAFIKVIAGPKKTSKVISDEDKRITAVHEAGHAVLTKLVEPYESVHHISIIPSGQAAGYTMSLPKDDRDHLSKTHMENKIVTLLGGRVAESLVIGDICTGASNDLQRASSIARSMVTKYGMSDELGPVVYGSEHNDDEVFLGRDFNTARNYSEDTAAKIDREIKTILETAYAKAKQLLSDNLDKLNFIADYLISHEIMESYQFDAVMEGEPTVEELEEMREEKLRCSREENELRAAEKRVEVTSPEAADAPGTSDETKPNGDGSSDAENSGSDSEEK